MITRREPRGYRARPRPRRLGGPPRATGLSRRLGRAIVQLSVGKLQARVRRANLAGWLFVVLVAGLLEAAVRLLDLEDSVAAPSEALRALVDGMTSGALSGQPGP